ncbi:MAG TPA: baseplate J/gp47 family protein, partial [Ruminiclostridium sp.]|nr:baseplate J/gp47 family protein [Ruminiclostridium sp.]
MYETQTEEAIKQRMLDKISTEIDKSEGSFSYDAVAPVAVELAQSYIEIDRILALAFAQNSSGSYLDMRTAEFGITRNTGSKATGTVRFTGSDGVIIPEGTQLQTTGGLVYTTQSSVTISGGTADADVMAEATGIIYNVPAGSINQLPVQIVGVTGVTNNGTLTGGCDVESDEGLLERLLTKVRTPSTSGNANDYKLWALSVSGIGDAKVFP